MITSKHPLILLSAKLSELCKPLELFGIHHFTFLKQYTNGKRLSLSNKPSWIEDYYNLNLYQSSLFENPLSAGESSLNIWFGDYDLDVYRHGRDYYNTMHSISIVEFKHDCCETYLFATTPDNPQCIHYLSNHKEILYHFILYLKDRGKSIFQSAEKNGILMPGSEWKVESEPISWIQTAEWLNQMNENKIKFFTETPIHQLAFENKELNNIHFTQREMMCIVYLLNYKTASETGKLMNLSSRTVESYLDNIKLKLNCTTKSEIIFKLKNSPYWAAIMNYE